MKQWLSRIAALALTFGLSLLVAEFGLRVFAPLHLAGYQGAYVYDGDLGYRLRPEAHYLVTTDHPQEIRTNALGTVNLPESFREYDRLVHAIGDSFTQGSGLPADASYPFQLDLSLNLPDGEYHHDYGVINLGLAAYGLEQAMVVLDRYAAELGPRDCVLYFACGNDPSDDELLLSGYRLGHLGEGSPRLGVLGRAEFSRVRRLARAGPDGDESDPRASGRESPLGRTPSRLGESADRRELRGCHSSHQSRGGVVSPHDSRDDHGCRMPREGAA